MDSRYAQMYNAMPVKIDPVVYPYQRPSDAELKKGSIWNYRFRCHFRCEEIIRYLMHTFSLGNLRTIVKEHVRYLRSTSSFRKSDLSLLVVTYMMLLLVNDEQEEYKRMIKVMKDVLRDSNSRNRDLDWWPISDFISDGDKLVSLSQELYGKVEWPAVRPLLKVTPVAPLVCVDVLPVDSYAEVCFKIPNPRPTDPKCRYFLVWYRLQDIPPEYSTFMSKNSSNIKQILSICNEQLKKQINSDIIYVTPDIRSPVLYEHFSMKIHQKIAEPMLTSEQVDRMTLANEEVTNSFSKSTTSRPSQEDTSPPTTSSSVKEPIPALEGCPKLDLKADDLEISTFHGIHTTLNQSHLTLGIGRAVYPINVNTLRFNGYVNTLTVKRSVDHEGLNPHVFQIVEAIVDPEEWTKLYGTVTMATVSAESVKRVFFTNKVKNDDIESLDLTLPLKCPLTMVRLKTPVRGSNCKHLSCFDHSSLAFLLKNVHGFFRCPNCNKDVSETEIVIDGFVQDILSKTEGNVDEVTIDSKTGEWRVKTCSSNVLESSGEEQPMPKIPRMEEHFLSDDLKVVSSHALLGSSITNAIVLD